MLNAIQRIVPAECHSSGSPNDAEFELLDRFPLTDNDPQVATRVNDVFAQYFGDRFPTMAGRAPPKFQ